MLGTAGGSEKKEFFEPLRAVSTIKKFNALNYNSYLRQYFVENKKVAITATCYSLIDFLAAAGGFLISLQKTFVPIASFLSSTTFTYGAISTLFQARVSRKNIAGETSK